MKIIVNANPREIAAITLDAALAELGYPDTSIATAVNGAFVPVPNRGSTVLAEGDRLEILSPMQGG